MSQSSVYSLEISSSHCKAEAIRQYIKQQKGSLEMQNQAAEIKLRAERRAGEILKEIPRADPRDNLLRGSMVALRDIVPFETVCKQNELPTTTAKRWQLEAEIPEAQFEQFVLETKAKVSASKNCPESIDRVYTFMLLLDHEYRITQAEMSTVRL